MPHIHRFEASGPLNHFITKVPLALCFLCAHLYECVLNVLAVKQVLSHVAMNNEPKYTQLQVTAKIKHHLWKDFNNTGSTDSGRKGILYNASDPCG